MEAESLGNKLGMHLSFISYVIILVALDRVQSLSSEVISFEV